MSSVRRCLLFHLLFGVNVYGSPSLDSLVGVGVSGGPSPVGVGGAPLLSSRTRLVKNAAPASPRTLKNVVPLDARRAVAPPVDARVDDEEGTTTAHALDFGLLGIDAATQLYFDARKRNAYGAPGQWLLKKNELVFNAGESTKTAGGYNHDGSTTGGVRLFDNSTVFPLVSGLSPSGDDARGPGDYSRGPSFKTMRCLVRASSWKYNRSERGGPL